MTKFTASKYQQLTRTIERCNKQIAAARKVRDDVMKEHRYNVSRRKPKSS